MKKRAAVITASDSGYRGEREDLSGPEAKKILEEAGYFVQEVILLPDDQKMLEECLKKLADQNQADLIVTTGGTGFSHRDTTPEATLAVVERLTPGIPEAIRAYSLTITPRAMLSRAQAGIRQNSLIVNLPGSPKAVRETLDYILPSLEHGLEILLGEASNCAR